MGSDAAPDRRRPARPTSTPRECGDRLGSVEQFSQSVPPPCGAKSNTMESLSTRHAPHAAQPQPTPPHPAASRAKVKDGLQCVQDMAPVAKRLRATTDGRTSARHARPRTGFPAGRLGGLLLAVLLVTFTPLRAAPGHRQARSAHSTGSPCCRKRSPSPCRRSRSDRT